MLIIPEEECISNGLDRKGKRPNIKRIKFSAKRWVPRFPLEIICDKEITKESKLN